MTSNPEQVTTFIDDTVYVDRKLNKPYLNKSDVKSVFYYDSKTKSLFKIEVDDDAIEEDKIFLNLISEKAQAQLNLNKEGIVCVNMQRKLTTKMNTFFNFQTTLLPDEEVFIQKETSSRSWQRAKVVEFSRRNREVLVELLPSDLKLKPNKINRITVPFERIAYLVPPYKQLTKAFRIVAKILVKGGRVNYLSGRILDLAKKTNKFRYLVFFEGGITSYVNTKDIAVILDQSKGYDNFNAFQKEFLNFYFKFYPEVPLVKFKIGEKCLIRLKMPNQGEEVYIRATGVVTKIDEKLVQFHCPIQNTHVWLFRGDFTRILSIKNDNKTKEGLKRLRPLRKVGSQHNIIEITLDDDLDEDASVDEEIEEEEVQPARVIPPLENFEETSIRAGASTVSSKVSLASIKEHKCSELCLIPKEREPNLSLKNVNIYIIPMVFGWRRLYEFKFDHIKVIFYLSPCGIKFYGIEAIFDYLQNTKSILQIDQFNLDPYFIIQEEKELGNNKYFVYLKDISGNKENQPISFINSVNKEILCDFEYIAKREFHENVQIQLDNNFMVCCDCTDNCRNSEKCSCQRLTLESSLAVHDFTELPMKNRLLEHKILSGIYECNNGCACRSNMNQCVNRNVQLGIRNKLQIFKTFNKGWGVRALHDIPKGSFICTYAGIVLDNDTADEEGLECDTFLADLDLIEHLESTKGESCLPTFSLDENNFPLIEDKFRKIFDEKAPYAINGAKKGNIGRFINHSCSPNTFAQNVFVDSHDLRFPWLSFFAQTHIPAYTEITWDYDYEINCVPGKQIACQCGSENCRIRLM